MPKKQTHIAFNPDTMTVGDLKYCASALASILDDFDRFLMEHPDWGPKQAEEFAMRVLQVREHYTTTREIRKSDEEPSESDQGLIPIPDGYAEQ